MLSYDSKLMSCNGMRQDSKGMRRNGKGMRWHRKEKYWHGSELIVVHIQLCDGYFVEEALKWISNKLSKLYNIFRFVLNALTYNDNNNEVQQFILYRSVKIVVIILNVYMYTFFFLDIV